MLKLHDKLATNYLGKEIIGQIVGIDHYHLENFDNKKHMWPSYTLVSKNGGLFKRYWITDWKKAGWFLWTGCPKKAKLQFKRVIQDRSGLATIAFAGDQGISTPTAALVVYELDDGGYYSTERFSGSGVLYFRAQKIPKPKNIKT